MDMTQSQEQKIVKNMLKEMIDNTYNQMLELHPESKKELELMRDMKYDQLGIKKNE